MLATADSLCKMTVFDFYTQSVIARGTLLSISQRQNYVPVFINFSAQTSSARTQEMIEMKLEKRRKNVIGDLFSADIIDLFRCAA